MRATWYALLVVLVIGATARLTRLITGDDITKPIRDRIEAKATAIGGRGIWIWLDDLLTCPWCVSMWVGFPASFVAWWFPTNRFVLASMSALTASLITGHIQSREPESEDPG